MNIDSSAEISKWLEYVELYANAYDFGRKIFVTEAYNQVPTYISKNKSLPPVSQKDRGGPKVLICSPHPDDECLTGGLPLRLLKERDAQVLNIAVTLGSDILQRPRRKIELENACAILNFRNKLIAGQEPFEKVNKKVRSENQERWDKMVLILVDIFKEFEPDFVFMPHLQDNHPTHEGVSLLATDALVKYTKEADRLVFAVENEFWQPNLKANLLIGISNYDLATLICGVAQHRGEIARNPYHLRMPARLIDNVRRGAELFEGGGSGSNCLFADLYRVLIYRAGERQTWSGTKQYYSPDCRLDFFLDTKF